MMGAQHITSDVLAAGPVTHAFFTRKGGFSDGVYASLNGGLGSKDDPKIVAQNRVLMAETLGVEPESFLTPYLVHSPDCLIVDAPFGEPRPRCDALVTKTRKLALSVTGADCGVILFSDPGAGVIGAAHAGWKGAFGGVLENTLQAMEECGASRPSIVAVLGPTIGASSYEVGPEFQARFVEAHARDARFFAPSTNEGRFLFDLPNYIGARLRAAGVGAFHDLALDTYADEDRFYSYRRATHRGESDYGRLVAAIALN